MRLQAEFAALHHDVCKVKIQSELMIKAGAIVSDERALMSAHTVVGDEMTIDLSESDAQRKGFINCTESVTYGIAVAAAILYFDPALADYHSEGSLRPTTFPCSSTAVVPATSMTFPTRTARE